MANPEHLKLLKSGVSAWNEWRAQNSQITPNLDDAELESANLAKANLHRAKLCRCNLMTANLRDAILSDAIMYDTNLDRADLTGADLSGAVMENTNLYYADLRGAKCKSATFDSASLWNAHLAGADFSDTNMAGALLHGAQLTGTIFQRANFRSAVLDGAAFGDVKNPTDFSDADFRWNDLHINGFDLPYFLCSRGLTSAKFDDRADFLSLVTKFLELAPNKDMFDSMVSLASSLRDVCGLTEVLSTKLWVPDDLSIACASIRDMVGWLSISPEKLFELTSREFERVVAEILRGLGWNVELTKATRDGGYDILGIQKDISGASSSWVIECKRYRQDRIVGVDIVRNLFGVNPVLTKGANILIATTSSFSRDAHEFKASRYNLELVDYEAIVDWLQAYKTSK